MNTKSNHQLSIEWIGLLYIIVVSILCYLLPIPELIKVILAFPAILAYYYLLGYSVTHKRDIFGKIFYQLEWDILSKFIFFWWIGFLINVLIITGIIFIGQIFLIYFHTSFIETYIMRYIALYIIIFVSFLLLSNYKCNNSNYKIDVQKYIFQLHIMGIDKITIPFFILFSITIVQISKNVIPFPFFGNGFASPSTNVYFVTRWLTDGYFNIWRIFEVNHLYIGSFFFNIDPIAHIWMVPYFAIFGSMLGIYLWSYFISENKYISLISAIFGMLYMTSTSEWGNSILDGFKGNYFFGVIIPFTLFFIHKNIKKEKQDVAKYIIPFSLLWFVIFIFGLYVSFGKHSVQESYLLHFIFTIVLFFSIILITKTCNRSNNANIYIFIIMSFSAMFFHDSEFIFYVFLVFLYFIVLNITLINKKYKALTHLPIVFIIIAFSYAITQYFELVHINNLNFVGELLPSSGFITELDISWKIYALEKWSSPLILMFFSIGVIVLLLKHKRKEIPLLTMSAFIIAIYFFPVDITYRIEKFNGPFIGYCVGVFVWILSSRILRIENKKKHLYFSVCVLLIIVAFGIISSISIIHSKMLPAQGHSTSTSLANHEYNATLWIRDNLPDNTMLLTDWFSYFVFVPLSNKVSYITLDMSDYLGASSDIDKEKWNIIRKDVFAANSSKAAYEHVQKLTSLPITYPREKMYVEMKSINDPNFNDYNFVIILTDRSITWFNQPDSANVVLPRMTTTYSVEKINQDSKYFNLFNDSNYFTMLYNDSSLVYIFGVNPEPGVPFEI